MSLWILASRMAPPIAFTIPYFLAYRHLELLDTRTGLVIIYMTFNLSLVIWMMRPFFDQLPRALEEAAWIDGARLAESAQRHDLVGTDGDQEQLIAELPLAAALPGVATPGDEPLVVGPGEELLSRHGGDPSTGPRVQDRRGDRCPVAREITREELPVG